MQDKSATPMNTLYTIHSRDGMPYPRRAWTGGDTAPAGLRHQSAMYRTLVSGFFRESLQECGGLDFWKCAGTSALERARIFWNRAKLDGWRTFSENHITLPPKTVFSPSRIRTV